MGGLKAPVAGQLKSADGITTSRAALPPIQVNRWARNGKHPNALLESMKADAANSIGMFRTKEVFRLTGSWPMIPAVDGGPWRFAFHSGPYARAVYALICGGPLGGATGDTYTQLDIADSTGAIVATDQFHYGFDAFGLAAGTESLDSIVAIPKILLINPDTDYYAKLANGTTNTLFQSASIYELASLTENFAGYLSQNFVAQGPVLASARMNLATLTRALWRRGAATVFNWTTNLGTTGGTTNATASAKNIVDTSFTTVAASAPGWTINMTGKARLTQTSGVTVRMSVCASVAAGAAGTVQIKNSTGAVVASVVNGWTASPTWQTVAFSLPATTDKYDVHLTGDGVNLFAVHAVSVYEYEP